MIELDRQLLLWLNAAAGDYPILDHAARLVASDYLMLAVLSSAAFGLWFAGRDALERISCQRATLIAAASIGLSNAAVWIASLLFERMRPYEDLDGMVNLLFYRSTDPSFPSNPVAVAFAGATAVWIGSRRLGIALTCLSAIYAFARVYVGSNYPGDVVGGAVIGCLVTGFAYLLFVFGRPIPEGALRLMRGIAGA